MKKIYNIINILLIIAIAGVIVWGVKKNIQPQFNTSINTISNNDLMTRNKSMSIYWWKSPVNISDAEWMEALKFLEKENIKTIYLDMTDYLDIYEDTNVLSRETNIRNFEKAMEKKITLANQGGIEVQGLAGGTQWSNPSHEYIPFLIMDFALSYNKSHPEARLTGMQFDMEYYLQPEYENNKEEFGQYYLSVVNKLMNKAFEYNLAQKQIFKLGMTIPFWLDKDFGNSVFKKLADLMNKNIGSYLAIMAYRNYAEGEDGSIRLVEDELKYVSTKAQNVNIWVAQETAVYDPPKTTFAGKSRKEAQKSFAKITDHFKENPNFAGIAIHQMESYRSLKD